MLQNPQQGFGGIDHVRLLSSSRKECEEEVRGCTEEEFLCLTSRLALGCLRYEFGIFLCLSYLLPTSIPGCEFQKGQAGLIHSSMPSSPGS